MTETKTTYMTPGSHNLHIPSKQDFRLYASNLLTNTDFCTDCPGCAAQKVGDAISWTYSNERKRGMSWVYGWK